MTMMMEVGQCLATTDSNNRSFTVLPSFVVTPDSASGRDVRLVSVILAPPRTRCVDG